MLAPRFNLIAARLRLDWLRAARFSGGETSKRLFPQGLEAPK
jgi:hypothetical protein